EAEGRQERLEGDALADMREGRAVEVEAERPLRAVGRLGQPAKARLRVDEAAEQPGARDAVHPGAAPRGPVRPWYCAASSRSTRARAACGSSGDSSCPMRRFSSPKAASASTLARPG